MLRPYVLARTTDSTVAAKVMSFLEKTSPGCEAYLFRDGGCFCIEMQNEPTEVLTSSVQAYIMALEDK